MIYLFYFCNNILTFYFTYIKADVSVTISGQVKHLIWQVEYQWMGKNLPVSSVVTELVCWC